MHVGNNNWYHEIIVQYISIISAIQYCYYKVATTIIINEIIIVQNNQQHFLAFLSHLFEQHSLYFVHGLPRRLQVIFSTRKITMDIIAKIVAYIHTYSILSHSHVTHYFTCNLTTGIIILMYYVYGVLSSAVSTHFILCLWTSHYLIR